MELTIVWPSSQSFTASVPIPAVPALTLPVAQPVAPLPAPVPVVVKPRVDTLKIMQRFTDTRRAANRSEYYVKSAIAYHRRFAKAFPDMATVTVADLEKWFTQFRNPNSRRTWMNRVSSLFGYCVRQEILEKNPVDKIEKPTPPGNDPIILTVDQAQALLRHCPYHIRGYLALGLWAGVRPFEILRARWEDFNWDGNCIRIKGKTRRRRHVFLEPAARAILDKVRQDEGLIVSSRSTLVRWLRKARLLIGGKWTPDILRHTAASMLLAKYGDAGKVSTMLGNSPQILLTHYNNPVTREEADKFWAIR